MFVKERSLVNSTGANIPVCGLGNSARVAGDCSFFFDRRLAAKVAAAVVALLPSQVVGQQRDAGQRTPSVASSIGGLDSLNVPQASRSGDQHQPLPQLRLKSNYAIDQGPGFARYKIDQVGRVTEVHFPTGLAVTDITYQEGNGARDIIAGLTVSSNGSVKNYSRRTFTWMVTTKSGTLTHPAPDFVGDFLITTCGEFVSINAQQSGANQVYTATGEVFGMQLCRTGAYIYLHPNGEVHGLRRADNSKLTLRYQAKALSEITEERQGSAERSWRFDAASKLWVCSDPDILPSSNSPFFDSGIVYFTRADGSRESISTSGARTLWWGDGAITVFDHIGRIYRVARGAQSRTFEYDATGSLIGFRDSSASRSSETRLVNTKLYEYRVRREGSVQLPGSCFSADERRRQIPLISYPLSLTTSSSQYAAWHFSPIPIHPHEESPKGIRGLCKTGVCPDTPPTLGVRGVFNRTRDTAIGQDSLIKPETDSWTTLDSIEKHRNGILAPVAEFLRIWAETTTDDDIARVASPETLTTLRSDDGTRWLQPELLGPASADYLIWLRDSVRSNRLPCTMDVIPLHYAGTDKQQTLGAKTVTDYSLLKDSVTIAVFFQPGIFNPKTLQADIEAMHSYGGVGVLRPDEFYNSAALLQVLFHELGHVFEAHTGRETAGGEPTANLYAYLALSTITPDKAPAYRPILNLINQPRRTTSGQ
jgi:hypothetical protein